MNKNPHSTPAMLRYFTISTQHEPVQNNNEKDIGTLDNDLLAKEAILALKIDHVFFTIAWKKKCTS